MANHALRPSLRRTCLLCCVIFADAAWVPKIGCEQFERNDFFRQKRRRK